jgi:hypothetical protein
MWVVQELCVADRALIIFSGSALPWTNFLRAFFYLHYSLDAPITNIRKLVGLEKIRQAWIQGKRQPLRGTYRGSTFLPIRDVLRGVPLETISRLFSL